MPEIVYVTFIEWVLDFIQPWLDAQDRDNNQAQAWLLQTYLMSPTTINQKVKLPLRHIGEGR